MNITRELIAGSATAAKLVKQFLTLPRISCENPNFTIVLEPESFTKHGEANVSQNLVIMAGSGGNQYVADNVVPAPLSWSAQGYIPGNQLIEITNLYTPILKSNVKKLWQAFKKGAQLTLRDNWGDKYDVVISSLDTDLMADCANKSPFTMNLQEIVTASADATALTATEEASSVEQGDVDSATPENAGSLQNKSSNVTMIKNAYNNGSLSSLLPF